MNQFEKRQNVNVGELAQRVVEAARREQPSAELTGRMASGLGLSVSEVLGELAKKPAELPVPETPNNAPHSETATELPKGVLRGGANGSTSTASSFLGGWLPWLAGVVVVAGAGTIVATRSTGEQQSQQSPAVLSAFKVQEPEVPSQDPAVLPPQPVLTPSAASEHRSSMVIPATENAAVRTSARPPSDLSAEIALIDGVRSALHAGSHARALALISQYESQYPKGSFRPEAAALRIEGLVKLGRTSEARILAERFVNKHRGLPLADRVARIVNISPSTP